MTTISGDVLWGLIREYVQAEVNYEKCRTLARLGGSNYALPSAAEHVTRTETAVRELSQKLKFEVI